MERYCIAFPSKPDTWEDEIIKHVTELPFYCVNLLGKGANASVHSICHEPEEDEGEDEDEDEDEDEGDEEEEEEEEEDEEEEKDAYDPDWEHNYFGLNDLVKTVDNDEDSEESCTTSSSGSEDEDAEWSTVQKDGSTRATTQPHECVTTRSPMGTVEVVAKKFVNLTRNSLCYEGVDSVTNKLTVCAPMEYLDWLVEQKNPIQTREIQHRITANSACFNGFVSESLCHVLVTDLVAKSVTPHVVMAFRALQCRDTGYLLQERINSTIEEFLEETPGVDAGGMASLYLQAFVTLHVLQDSCNFKHADLHTDNLFIKEIDEDMEWKGVKLKGASHFSYNLGDVTLTVPNIGYIVKIGDFGCATLDAFGHRIQTLDSNVKKPRWGDTNTKLNHVGYDGQFLMGSPPFDQHSWRAKDAPTQEVLTRLRKCAQGPNGKLTWALCRPAQGHVSDVAPLDVVKQVFVQNPPSFADFTNTPTDTTRVVCLTDVADLSTTHPRKPKRRRRTRMCN
jgi:hypothetical protein